MHKARIGFGIIIGAAAGIIAGILTSPKSGKATRADIHKKAEELKKEASQHADEIYEKSDKIIKDAKLRTASLLDKYTSSNNHKK
jgi:gas vesicle protein